VAREMTNSSGSPVRVARRFFERRRLRARPRTFCIIRDRQRFVQLHDFIFQRFAERARTAIIMKMKCERPENPALRPVFTGSSPFIQQRTRRTRPPSWLPRPIGRLLSPALLRPAQTTRPSQSSEEEEVKATRPARSAANAP
jgi:hypothetical protein